MWTWRYEGTGELTKSGEGRRFVASLFLSFGIILIGMAWTMRVGRDSNQLFHKLSHTQEAVDGMRKVISRSRTQEKHIQ